MSPRETGSLTRGEERRVRVRSGATAGVPRSSEPSSLVRPFGSREVLCISSTLDEINSSAPPLLPDFTATNRIDGSLHAVPNFRPNVIVAQCLIGVKMPTVESLACPTRGPAGSATAAGRPPPTLAVAPQTGPLWRVGRRRDASPQDVPG